MNTIKTTTNNMKKVISKYTEIICNPPEDKTLEEVMNDFHAYCQAYQLDKSLENHLSNLLSENISELY